MQADQPQRFTQSILGFIEAAGIQAIASKIAQYPSGSLKVVLSGNSFDGAPVDWLGLVETMKRRARAVATIGSSA